MPVAEAGRREVKDMDLAATRSKGLGRSGSIVQVGGALWALYAVGNSEDRESGRKAEGTESTELNSRGRKQAGRSVPNKRRVPAVGTLAAMNVIHSRCSIR